MTEEEARDRAAAVAGEEQEIRIPIEYWMVGGVIGPGGSIVKRLSHESKCRIKVESAPKGSDANSPGFVVIGPAMPDMLPKAEALVRRRLEEILAEGPNSGKGREATKQVSNSFSVGPVKERLCHFWTMGACPMAENCVDAHGEHEIGARVTNSAEARKVRELPLDSRLVGAMIGPKGMRLQSIREQTGVSIRLEKGDAPESPTVIRFGPASDEQLDSVEAQIRDVIEAARSGLRQDPSGDGKVIDVTFDVKLVGALIGPRGANLQGLRERAGCRISVVDQDVERGAATIRIGPLPDEMVLETARVLVLEAIETAKRTTPVDRERVAELPLDPRLVGALLGPGGSRMQALCARAGCRVVIEKGKDGGGAGVPAKVLIGPATEQTLRHAEQEVRAAIEAAARGGGGDGTMQDVPCACAAPIPGRVFEMKVDARLVGALIGPRGCHQQALETIVGCRVFIDKTEGLSTVYLGPASEPVLQAAQREIAAAVRAARAAAAARGPGWAHFGVAAHLGVEAALAVCQGMGAGTQQQQPLWPGLQGGGYTVGRGIGEGPLAVGPVPPFGWS